VPRLPVWDDRLRAEVVGRMSAHIHLMLELQYGLRKMWAEIEQLLNEANE
jgi:hypothetical protein